MEIGGIISGGLVVAFDVGVDVDSMLLAVVWVVVLIVVETFEGGSSVVDPGVRMLLLVVGGCAGTREELLRMNVVESVVTFFVVCGVADSDPGLDVVTFRCEEVVLRGKVRDAMLELDVVTFGCEEVELGVKVRDTMLELSARVVLGSEVNEGTSALEVEVTIVVLSDRVLDVLLDAVEEVVSIRVVVVKMVVFDDCSELFVPTLEVLFGKMVSVEMDTGVRVADVVDEVLREVVEGVLDVGVFRGVEVTERLEEEFWKIVEEFEVVVRKLEGVGDVATVISVHIQPVPRSQQKLLHMLGHFALTCTC